jgi:hypothetical protein
MKAEEASFPCPSCGFEVFSEQPGSYEICDLCGWEDDHVQLRFPAMAGGSNKLSLAEHQMQAIAAYPLNVSLAKGVRRCKEWRPIVESEVVLPQQPTSGHEYFNAAAEEAPQYYWRHRTMPELTGCHMRSISKGSNERNQVFLWH